MRSVCFIICVALWSGCTSTTQTLNQERRLDGKLVALSADSVHLEIDTPHVNNQAKKRLQRGRLDSLGDAILDQMITGFRLDRERNIQYSSEFQRADLQLKVDTIWVSRGRFTLDFTHPGPIFSLKLKMNGYDNQKLVFRKYYKARQNFAHVIGRNDSFYWPGGDDKNNTKYQLETLLKGIRPIFGKSFADFLKIDQYQ